MKTTLRLLALALALAPFALVCCKAQEPAAPAATAGAGPAATAAASPVASAAARPAASSPDSPEDAGSAASAESPTDPAFPPPYRGPVPGSCAELETGMIALFEDRACTRDGECTVSNIPCSCSTALARRGLPKLEKLRSAYEQMSCRNRGRPRPCATCPPPPRAHCHDGQCS